MASKSAQHEPEKAEVIEEALDHCDTTLDRVKVLYEQFFLGIQKQPPSYLHTDVERKLRELQQMQIRNTALRYRFSTIQQKFGSYNNYWRRTLRQIENGTYHRNLAKVGRQAALNGEDIPDEILAAMPKRMREQVKRDREAALAAKRRRDASEGGDDFTDEVATGTAAAPRVARGGAHVLEDDGDFDLDAYFRAVTNDDSETLAASQSRRETESEVFSSEVPTDNDLVAARPVPVPVIAATPAPAPAPQPAARPSSPTMTPGHANPAVRAAVGMRLATPPAGVPLAARLAPSSRQSQPIATQPQPPSHDSDVIPTQAIPTMRPTPPSHDSGVIPTQAIPTMRAGLPPQRPAPGGLPAIPSPGQSGPRPSAPAPAPSQVVRPLPVMPGAASNRGPVAVETLAGPFPREQPQPTSTSTPPAGHPAARTAPGLGPGRPGAPPGSTQAIPRPPGAPGSTQAIPRPPQPPGSTQAIPRPPQPPASSTQAIPRAAQPGASGSMTASTSGSMTASASGSMTKAGASSPAMKRATTEPGVGSPSGRVGPPPGMTDADVNALYSKYVKAKEAVGEKAGPGSYGKLLQTINAQAPKIMEQYKAKGVEFQVVVKDNQVVIRAKPKP